MEELDPWIDRIRHIARQSKITFVITNNHARGKAVANGLQLIALVTGHAVHVPESLVKEYPDLTLIITATPTAALQASLPLVEPDDPS